MALWNLRAVPEELAREVKSVAAIRGVTLQEFVIRAVEKELGNAGSSEIKVSKMRKNIQPAIVSEEAPKDGTQKANPVGTLIENRDEVADVIASSPIMSAMNKGHDVKRCRVYRCGRCEGLGVKDSNRGLK